jgi:endonuclease/exonuclease/phosphatase family metal-dependent hydrolase
MAIRVGTFNCENLFSRSRILDFNATPTQAEQATAALTAAQQLKSILNKKTFTAADKKKILALIKQGKGFFTVEEDRGKLLKGNKVVANGVDDFVGHIRFVTQDVSSVATKNTAKVINALGADVLCVCEVENRELLGKFNTQTLGSKRFTHHMVIDGNDERGIDVGLLSNVAFRNIRTHVDDKDGNSLIFSRDCAEYEIVLDDGRSLWLLFNHFKSKGFGTQAANDARRLKQATRVAQILAEQFNLAQDLVIVAGDLNDTPASAPLAPLLGLAGLHNIIDTLPAPDRFTDVFGTERSQIDYLLVSTPLKNVLQSVTIERRGMFTVPGHFPSVDNEAHAASDHAAVVAEFAV